MRNFMILPLMLLFLSVNAQSRSYIFVFLHKRTNTAEIAKDSVERLMKGHMANIERLAKEKKLLVAGPFEGGGGLFILNTTSKDVAKSWLQTDPGIQANRWDVEMLDYLPQLGSVCTPGEPYEMVTYDLIRFHEDSSKGANELTEHGKLVNKEYQNGNVITWGNFGSSGKILILKNGTVDAFLKASPAVERGVLKPETKKLWIAKGSFCEK